MIIHFFLSLFIPLCFSALFCKKTYTHLDAWIIDVLFFGSYVLALFFLGLWPLAGSYFLRYLIVSLFFGSVLISLLQNHLAIRWKFQAAHALPLLLTVFFASLITASLYGSHKPPHCIELAFPLKGDFTYVAQGGNHRLLNHHFSCPAQKYALDLLQLNLYGSRSHTLIPLQLTDFLSYQAPIYSPCDGLVIALQDGGEDQPPGVADPSHPAGNYLAIQKADDDVVVILAHLLKHSFAVKRGEAVKTGDLVGKIGNSGNTSEPHLHIHCLRSNSGDFFGEGEGVPMAFEGKFLSRNHVYH